MDANDSLILAARRTPIGAYRGQFGALSATDLGAHAIRAVLQAAALEPGLVDEILLGCVLQAGLGQAPARQAARAAGVPDSAAATTVNKVCGSGMKAVMLASDLLQAGSAALVIAGGMESMSNAPHLLRQARSGLGLGHRQLLDHLYCDGLENADDGRLMGHFAECCADRLGLTREAQDDYAATSLSRTLRAMRAGDFDREICPITLSDPAQSGAIDCDEPPRRCRADRIRSLRPVFRDGGSVTAASSAALSDGAAALLLGRARQAERLGLVPLARIVAHVSWAGPPADFPTAPAQAIRRLLRKTGWHAGDVDLYEINEAFAVVVLAAIRELDLDPARVNVNGGACALGHPIGATGARLLVTLVHALQQRRLQRGVAVLCIGGGEATAVALETG